MPADDFKPRKVLRKNGREANALFNREILGRLSEIDCGRWAGMDDLRSFTTSVLERIEPKGFAMTELERAALRRAREGEELGIDREFDLLWRSIDWVNANSLPGYHLGFKLGDLWYMPACWWEDTGGDERHSPREA